jgi:DNA-binding CsgD family transcriptional regulator
MLQKIFKYKIIRKPFEIIAGKSSCFTTDQQLLNLSLVLIGLSYLFTVPQNIITGLSTIITISNASETILIIILYYLSRKLRILKYTSLILIASIFVTLSIDWLPNGGLGGCIPYFFLVLLTYIIFLTSGVKRKILLIIFVLTITSLFTIEYCNPELVVPYKERWVLFEDLYTAYLCCMFSLIFIVYISKQLYLQEKKNTIDIIELYRKNSENLQNTFNEKSSLLSFREREIFKLIIEGKSNKKIASQLFIEERTVKNHITSIYKKIEVKKRTELISQF